ncbi:MAG: MBOAT family protein [Flavobacteriales bacterium]
MLFNSLDFIYFLPIVLLCYQLAPVKWRLYVLLAASYVFYMSWNPAYLILIIASSLADYVAGKLLGVSEKPAIRKMILAVSLAFNLGLLAYFKYANFLLANVGRAAAHIDAITIDVHPLDIILPVGISFYTFQTMSYTIDVYNKKITPEQNLGAFALYVSFFPQLVAGPIERFSTLRHQLKSFLGLKSEQISTAVRFILYGFFMKMVIADNIGVLVDKVYSGINELHSFSLILGAMLYSVQIYCDFHGYSTIAIGVACLFGITLSKNFNAPYFSHSLTEFWRNWHITLSTWFRDYIYYPLGGNKGSRLKWGLAILVVFIVSGIWHGAKWTFIIWGGMHGVLILIEKLFKLDVAHKNNVVKGVQVVFTFCLVSALFICFRSPSLKVALQYFHGLRHNWSGEFISVPLELIILLVGFFIIDYWTRSSDIAVRLKTLTLSVRWVFYLGFLFLILARSGADVQPFIYFQF